MTKAGKIRPFGVDDPATATALGAYVKLLRATRAIVSRVEGRLASNNLTTTQLGVLEGVLHKGPLTHRELGRIVLTSAGNMTDVVDKLERRALVRRERDTVDRRLVRVELTADGRQLIEELFPAHAGDIAQAMAGLAPTELDALSALLRRLGRSAAEAPDDACGGQATHLPE